MVKNLKTKTAIIIAAAALSLSTMLTACGGASSTEGSAAGAAKGTVKVSGASVKLVSDLAAAFNQENTGVTISVTESSSEQGIKDAGDGTSDIGVSFRALSSDEKSLGLTENQITKDSIAIVLNTANQATTFGRDQLAQIFSGQITNWSSVGGQDAPILVINRQDSPDLQATFEQELGITITPDAMALDGSGAVKAVLASNPDAISYIPVGEVDDTVLKASAEDFEMAVPILLLTKGEPKAEVKAFLDFIAGDKGKEIIKSAFQN